MLKQFDMYPKMQIQDMVKLIYQNEFGGGHYISSEAESLARLQREYKALRVTCAETFEDIGNGLCRLHLAPLQNYHLNISTANRFFVNTANSVTGNNDDLREKLSIFRIACHEGQLPYPAADVETYLADYQEAGFPPVSHSEIYRNHYAPAYRIVKSGYRDFFQLFCRIDNLLKSQAFVQVAIDGNCGAGKSTLAALIHSVYKCNVFHLDDYFPPPELKTEERYREAGANVDYVRFREEIIVGLKGRQAFQYRPYNCVVQAMEEPRVVEPTQLNIIEGAYSMHPTLISSYDLKVFLTVEPLEQSRRILDRNGPELHKRFIGEWIPLEERYFRELKIKEKCDLIFNT